MSDRRHALTRCLQFIARQLGEMIEDLLVQSFVGRVCPQLPLPEILHKVEDSLLGNLHGKTEKWDSLTHIPVRDSVPPCRFLARSGAIHDASAAGAAS
jgi:hypothetical protein